MDMEVEGRARHLAVAIEVEAGRGLVMNMECAGWTRDLDVDEEGEERTGELAVNVEGEGRIGGLGGRGG